MPTYDVKTIYDNGNHSSDKVKFFLPEHCPSCKAAISPVYLHGTINMDSKTFYAMFECRNCHSAFIMSADKVEKKGAAAFEILSDSVVELSPNRAVFQAFSDEIQDTSPKFVEIYNQAAAAEGYGLSEIAGIGYRKALEFLTKDYLCKCKEDAGKQKIIEKWLGTVIKEDVANPNIKAVAERAVWLGNDEAHYYRKWEGKDITDLKTLVRLTVGWIEQELITQQYVRDMPVDKR